MLFPFAAGWPFGIFAWLEINPAIQTTVIVTEIGLTILSILVLFENRYTFLSSNNKVWARTRSYTIRLLHVVAVTYFIPFNFLIPNQEIAISAITQKFPTLRTFYSGPIFVLTQDATLVVAVTAFKVKGSKSNGYRRRESDGSVELGGINGLEDTQLMTQESVKKNDKKTAIRNQDCQNSIANVVDMSTEFRCLKSWLMVSVRRSPQSDTEQSRNIRTNTKQMEISRKNEFEDQTRSRRALMISRAAARRPEELMM
ncbi:hypothetical protein GCK72_020138 [Caenorhabditis remanei]|uniref:Uncharacterized protein n=1 Tax=Caenorhabditis remanei TaxID=31234 RepID=A0A6A5GG76_CAERE|nr:hypothetical protein GCK72_020138 [Caenorhabditis remanei]KAF1753581.1 hypothetical protein GCK72_020138 [Caenorhabditis remanei]